jgi:hypothetical protein
MIPALNHLEAIRLDGMGMDKAWMKLHATKTGWIASIAARMSQLGCRQLYNGGGIHALRNRPSS